MRSKVSGRWIRQGDMIVVGDVGSNASVVDSEFRFPFSAHFFPAKTAGPGVSLASLPVPLFPPRPADPLVSDPKMSGALTRVVSTFEKDRRLKPGTLPIRFTIVDITDASGSFPSAGYLETMTDYIASEAKVSVMYSAYALRDMVQRFAASTGANQSNLWYLLGKQMNPSITKAISTMLAETYLLPSYQQVFELTPLDFAHRVVVKFTAGFDKALEGMIVPSENADAAASVHGVGYGYLNGALAAGGFSSLWVGGDFLGGKKWPYTLVPSRNDSLVAQAGTTRDMGKLVSLIMSDRLLDSASCAEMRGRLARGAKHPHTLPYVTRTGIFKRGTITHNKIGYGLLKSRREVWSEVSVYQSPVKEGKRYVVAWQNLVGGWRLGWTDVGNIIKATITEFEK